VKRAESWGVGMEVGDLNIATLQAEVFSIKVSKLKKSRCRDRACLMGDCVCSSTEGGPGNGNFFACMMMIYFFFSS